MGCKVMGCIYSLIEHGFWKKLPLASAWHEFEIHFQCLFCRHVKFTVLQTLLQKLVLGSKCNISLCRLPTSLQASSMAMGRVALSLCLLELPWTFLNSNQVIATSSRLAVDCLPSHHQEIVLLEPKAGDTQVLPWNATLLTPQKPTEFIFPRLLSLLRARCYVLSESSSVLTILGLGQQKPPGRKAY